MTDMSPTTKTWHLRLLDPKLQFVDFNIKASGTVFPAHKLFLARKSPFFAEMFSNDKHCKAHEIEEHSVESIEVCLLYMYSDVLRIDPMNVYDVIGLSKRLKMETVTKRCEDFLKDNLNQSNCLQMKKSATEHSLQQLADAANAMILANASTIAKNEALGELSSGDIQSLLRNPSHDDTNDFWLIFQAWARFTKHNVCDATTVVPYGTFTINSFKNAVWKHDHMHNCDNCKSVAAHQFLESIKEIPDDTSPDDLLFLKKLAKLYSFKEVEEMTFTFIAQHADEYISSCLIELLDKEELLTCLVNMETQCTQAIFNSLIQWIKNDSTRHVVFPFIFQYAQDPELEARSIFLSSIDAFVGLSEWCITDVDRSVDSGCTSNAYWFPQHSLFLKTLAKSYGYTRIEKQVDECIVGDFARVSQLPEFVKLSTDDILKYVSSLATYDHGANSVWQSIMKWINHDYEKRQDDFEDIFTSMKLDKFGNDLLRNEVLTSELVVNSNRALSLLLRLVMKRNNYLT